METKPLIWHGWEQRGDPYPFKAEANRDMQPAEFDGWATWCRETFGPGCAASGGIMLGENEWCWLGSRWRWPRAITRRAVTAAIAAREEDQPPEAEPTLTEATVVTVFSFRSETDRFVFILAASGE